jgi:hypothetical protein
VAMAAESTPLQLETIFTAEPLLAGRAADPDRLDRTAHVVFEYQDGTTQPYYEVLAYGSAFSPSPADEPIRTGRLERDEAWMLGMIADCLAVWDEYVAKHYDLPRGAPPFVPDRTHIETAGRRLADAGDRLFSAVFLQGDAGLREIGRRLADAMRAGEQTITFYSDRLFVPWWIIYSDDGTDSGHGPGHGWSPGGFWGYRHLIDHEFVRNIGCPDHRIKLGATPLRVSLNLDLSLDDRNGLPVTAPVRDFFERRRGDYAHVIRSTSDELRAALTSQEFGEHILYFCCHCGAQQSPYGGPYRTVLQLTDPERITPAHLCGWLRERKLSSNPFVFINACGGGLLNSQFYCSFGSELIRKSANCVVGPEVRVPAQFAGKYAVELFTRFLEQRYHLGPAMRQVTRHLMDTWHSPLGLVYGLYQGLDTRLVAGDLD